MTDTPWLDDAQRLAWVRFAAVLELLPRSLDAQLERDEQLSHFDYYCLAMLSEAPDRTLQLKTLARLSNGSLSRLSHTVTRLQNRGWVRRETSPHDGRATVAVLTDAGYAKVVETAPGHVELVRRVVFDSLRPADIGQLATSMSAILASIDPTWADPATS